MYFVSYQPVAGEGKMRMIMLFLMLGVLLSAITSAYSAPPASGDQESASSEPERVFDYQRYIDANLLLMMAANNGNVGYDIASLLGKNDGLYYPYSGIDDILNGHNNRTVLYSAGLWLGGVDAATSDTIVSVAEYSADYWPGPMVNGTFIPDADVDPAYRVYKLYRDSLWDNPNQDYLEWPVDQGAPVDANGHPTMIGDQLLWTVFNDANPASHTHPAGSWGVGHDIEVQQTVWASQDDGDIEIPTDSLLRVDKFGESRTRVTATIVDEGLLTGHDYMVIIDSIPVVGTHWRLTDITMDLVLLDSVTDFQGTNTTVTDGFLVQVYDSAGAFVHFEVVANALGLLIPPEPGALGFQNFPTTEPDPYGDWPNPTDRQQVGFGEWAFHTGDNGGTNGGGTRRSYEDFLARVTRYGSNNEAIGYADYEMRFTGATGSPGIEGSYAIEWFEDGNVFWVPFELWNIGSGTPDDPSDDYRLVPFILDIGEDNTFNLESWGTEANGGGNWEHSASGGDNDPYTDWVYWERPIDTSFGEAGYLANEADMLAGTFDYSLMDREVMARTVLINWNGGEQPPFDQDLPEQGTVFRLTTSKTVPIDTFTFTATPPAEIWTGPEGLSIYVKYKLINKGTKTLNDFIISFWSDPDLGDATDDLVGCDTLDDLHFCYNESEIDDEYGAMPPAVGVKLLEGPVVQSPGDTAFVDGIPIPDYRNLNMYAFNKYINGTDPHTPTETFRYMNGLDIDGFPLPNGTRYAVPGDPVTGTGDLDNNSADRRMMASFGPLTFAPNDTQQVILRIAVGQGGNRLESITELREILNSPVVLGPLVTSEMEPDPLHVLMGQVIEPITGWLWIGYDAARPRGKEINYGSLQLDGVAAIDSVVLVPGHPGFNGEVAKLFFNASEFVESLGAIYDTTLVQYLVTGEYVDASPLTHTGQVWFIGKLTGDFNLDGIVDIADLTLLVAYMFARAAMPPDIENMDITGDCKCNVIDITYFVCYLYDSGPPPVPCP